MKSYWKTSIDSKFDLIVCSDTLEHLERPARVLRSMRHLLKDFGFDLCHDTKLREPVSEDQLAFHRQQFSIPHGKAGRIRPHFSLPFSRYDNAIKQSWAGMRGKERATLRSPDL